MRRVSRKKRKNNEHGSVENFTTKTNICRYIVETRWQIQSADTQWACAAYIIRFAVLCNELLLGAPKGLLPLSVLRVSSAYVLLDSIAIFMDSIPIYILNRIPRAHVCQSAIAYPYVLGSCKTYGQAQNICRHHGGLGTLDEMCHLN